MLALLFLLGSATAQTNADEAKGAYLLAEESFEKGDYKTALEFLLQAREALGGANCKLIFLQIQATRERYAKDTSLNGKLYPLILEFEKSTDYPGFNEEKKMEITKLKLVVKKELKAAQETADAESRIRLEREKNIAELVSQWPPLDITLDELDKFQPEWKVKEWKTTSWSKDFDVLHPAGFSYSKSDYPFARTKDNDSDTGRIANMILYQNKITCYCRYLIDFDGAAQHDNGTGYAAALKTIDENWKQVTEKTGIKRGGFSEMQYGGYTRKTAEWFTPKYFINDNARYRVKGGTGFVQLIRCVQLTGR